MNRFALTLLFLIVTNTGIFACTIFTVSKEGRVFIGNNEDWRHTDSYVRFIPASINKYGRVYFGFGRNCKYVFGGINDKGLFYDIASLRKRDDLVFDPENQTVDNEIYEVMLETCSNINEAIALLRSYNINGFKRHHIMIVERTGNSAIVEWGDDSLSIIRKANDYQIMTNFNNTLSRTHNRPQSDRFQIVEKQVEKLDFVTVNDVRIVLESVKNSGMNYQTIYSNIYDLVANEIYLFHYHNFEEYYKIDISKELDENGQSLYIPSIFSNLKLNQPSVSNNVELKWHGNAVKYRLYISDNPEFDSCNPIEISNPLNSSDDKKYLLSMLLFLLPVCVFSKGVRKTGIKSAVLLVILVIVSCTGTQTIEENKEYSYTFTEFEPNRIYYWKVQALKESDISTTSITKQFTTPSL